MIDPNAPAFPTQNGCKNDPGMTIRATMAMHIMSRISSPPSGDDLAIPLEVLGRSFAKVAIAYTDALIAELNKSEVKP